MTLALLLAQTGKLSASGLLCEMCERDPKRKAALGCMTPPVLNLGGEEAEWSVEFLERYAARLGVDPSPEFAASWMYGQANLHGISDYLPGELWACCPRSYAEFPDTSTRVAASEIIDAARDVLHEIPDTWILGGAQPSGQAKKLIRMSLAYLRNWQAEKVKGDA